MGLFSFLNKNKQESAATDSGYYSNADDDAVAARARSKRASSAGEPAARRGKDKAAADPVLPEKKRARRRLVGAIALALAVAVGLPMILDSEPKPLAGDIDIRIPSKDKAPPQPMPRPVAAAESLDKREQIVEEPPVTAVAPVAADTAPKPREVAEVKLPAPKPVVKPEVKPAEKVAQKPVEKPVEKPAAKPPVKVEEKPAVAKTPPPNEAARALSILEGKAPEKADTDDGQKQVVQVAALATQEKVTELQDKLREAGLRSYTQKVSTQSGERIRVLVGPYTKEEAEKVRAKLSKIGLSGSMVRS